MDIVLWRNLAAYAVATAVAMLLALLAAKTLVTVLSVM